MNNKSIGQILIHRQYNALGMPERYDYEWDGGPCVRVSYYLVDMADNRQIEYDKKQGVIRVGPYRLRIMEEYPWCDFFECVREDYWLWWAVVGWHLLSRIVDIAYRRLIITLAVWRLAEYDQGAIPHWKQIKIVIRVRKWISKPPGRT